MGFISSSAAGSASERVKTQAPTTPRLFPFSQRLSTMLAAWPLLACWCPACGNRRRRACRCFVPECLVRRFTPAASTGLC